MTVRDKLKTEHNGAKNGGGYWGRRVEAKAESRHRRRLNDRFEIENYFKENSESESSSDSTFKKIQDQDVQATEI
jgi:hypothetical protein